MTEVQNENKSVVVIGGGASGLMAAAIAAQLGADVTLLEKMERPAKKILISGKGRCNVTTGHDINTSVAAFGKNGRFLFSAFSNFYNLDLVLLMESIGVPLKLERGKRYYPESDNASDIALALTSNVLNNGGQIECGMHVMDIKTRDGRVYGVEAADESPWGRGTLFFKADSVILATGGLSYPETGCTGDGYRFARHLGHSTTETRPALVPIELKGGAHNGLENLSLKNVGVALEENEKMLQEEFGEIKFMHYGVTGPAALNMSRKVSFHKNPQALNLVVNFKPALSTEQVNRRLLRELDTTGKRMIQRVLKTMLPQQAIPVLLRAAGVPHFRKGCEMTKDERDRLVQQFTAMRFPVNGVLPIERAIVTAGGVPVKEVDPRTMESKKTAGLYITGELLDIDAPTGGFNLQAAFSTGYTAGEAAANS